MEDTRAELLPELVELAEDEESSVRLAAFDTIINLMEMMDGGGSHDRSHVPQTHPAEGATQKIHQAHSRRR